MERIWLKHYPPGVSAEIDPSRYASLVAMLEKSFAQYRERTAFICMDKGLTYGETDEMSRAFGAWLQSRGLAKGARRHHDAERAAVSGVDLRRPACRLHRGEHQPFVHGARARDSAQGCRRRSHHRA